MMMPFRDDAGAQQKHPAGSFAEVVVAVVVAVVVVDVVVDVVLDVAAAGGERSVHGHGQDGDHGADLPWPSREKGRAGGFAFPWVAQ